MYCKCTSTWMDVMLLVLEMHQCTSTWMDVMLLVLEMHPTKLLVTIRKHWCVYVCTNVHT